MDTDTNESLQKIIEVARVGDLLAFEQLMNLFERRVYGYVCRHVSNREDAEDITQDVFVKVFKKLGTFDSARSFTTWLFTIATNTVYDYLRARKGKSELLILDDVESGFETIDPHEPYSYIGAQVDVAAALEKIKPTYRTALLLFYRDELSCEEIAEMLHVPTGTVKTHLARGRAALKEIL